MRNSFIALTAAAAAIAGIVTSDMSVDQDTSIAASLIMSSLVVAVSNRYGLKKLKLPKVASNGLIKLKRRIIISVRLSFSVRTKIIS